MEKVYDLMMKDGDVEIVEHKFFHREHAYCMTCGSKMMFKIEPRNKPFSGWTKNPVHIVTETCPSGCEWFALMDVFDYKGTFYTSDFDNLQDKINYMIEKEENKWNKRN